MLTTLCLGSMAVMAGVFGFLVREEMYRREQERLHRRVMAPPRMRLPDIDAGKRFWSDYTAAIEKAAQIRTNLNNAPEVVKRETD